MAPSLHCPALLLLTKQWSRIFIFTPFFDNFFAMFQPDTDSSYRVEGLKCECDTSSSSGGLAGSLFGLAGGNSTNQSLYDFTADDAAASGGIGINTADFFGGSEADSLHQQEEDSAGMFFFIFACYLYHVFVE